MKKRLIENFRAYILEHADRDDLRAFNLALETYPYLSFFSFLEVHGSNDTAYMLYIAFSSNDTEGSFDNYEARELCIKKDYLEFYVTSDLAWHFPQHRVCVSTKDVERFYVAPVSWDAIYKAPSLGEGDWYELSHAVFDYMNLQDPPWQSEFDCVEFLQAQDVITLDVVYNVDTTNLPRRVRKTTLVRYNGKIVGVLSANGRAGSPEYKAFSDNVPAFHAVLQQIILDAGLDKYREPDSIVVLDLNKDCDSYFGVPGITTPLDEREV